MTWARLAAAIITVAAAAALTWAAIFVHTLTDMVIRVAEILTR